MKKSSFLKFSQRQLTVTSKTTRIHQPPLKGILTMIRILQHRYCLHTTLTSSFRSSFHYLEHQTQNSESIGNLKPPTRSIFTMIRPQCWWRVLPPLVMSCVRQLPCLKHRI